MAGKKSELGPTGWTVASNIKRIRENQNLSYAELARRLEAIDRPIPVLGLSRIEKGDRRVDVDDLVALALVLNVTPNALLLPPTDDATRAARITGAGWNNAASIWHWAREESALPLGSDHGRQERETAQLQLHSNPAIQDITGAPNIMTGPYGEVPTSTEQGDLNGRR